MLLGPGKIADLPLGVLRKLVEAENLLLVLLLHVGDRNALCFHHRGIMAVGRRFNLRESRRVPILDEAMGAHTWANVTSNAKKARSKAAR
jgi:hypothetical protein